MSLNAETGSKTQWGIYSWAVKLSLAMREFKIVRTIFGRFAHLTARFLKFLAQI